MGVTVSAKNVNVIKMPKYFTEENLQKAFDVAEQETANHFNGQTCTMENVDGEEICPICYFRIRVKEHLGIPLIPVENENII